jgi:glycolate oxidase FAD binding subunit
MPTFPEVCDAPICCDSLRSSNFREGEQGLFEEYWACIIKEIRVNPPNPPNPRSIPAPGSADELADALRDASESGQMIVPWGAGTLQHLGLAPLPTAQPLLTTALNRVLEYNPADLTITVEAGATLGAIQAALRQHGQWLPWDPPAPEHATIGGLLAAAASGPLRLGYGTPRDWVLGMRVALGDGRLVKSGGKVVKNVAGYDTHKLHIGALGTLGVIVETTLKVAPLPERMDSLVFACASLADGCALAERLRERPLSPASLVVNTAAPELLPDMGALLGVRFAGVAAAVERQMRAALGIARSSTATLAELSTAQHAALWRALAGLAHPALDGDHTNDVLIIRAGAPAPMLPVVLEALERHAPPAASTQLAGYAGVGVVYARWYLAGAGADRAAQVLEALRAALASLGGYAAVESAPPQLRAQLDLWGAPPATLALMRALKAQYDPRAILNRGRYVGGI